MGIISMLNIPDNDVPTRAYFHESVLECGVFHTSDEFVNSEFEKLHELSKLRAKRHLFKVLKENKELYKPYCFLMAFVEAVKSDKLVNLVGYTDTYKTVEMNTFRNGEYQKTELSRDFLRVLGAEEKSRSLTDVKTYVISNPWIGEDLRYGGRNLQFEIIDRKTMEEILKSE